MKTRLVQLPNLGLIKKLLLPLRRFIGDMSQTERILLGLDLRKVNDQSASG